MADLDSGSKTVRKSKIDISEFAKRLEGKIRDQQILLKNLFRSVVISKSDSRDIRLHILKSDKNHRPQVGQLVRSLCDTILDYCIPRKQIERAIEHFKRTKSTMRLVALKTEAERLFTDISNTGEGGELLLFILTESVLGYPQALSKMAIKTSPKMHFHGLDGVYISCNGRPPNLRLHFGESKLRKNPSTSVTEAINSIAEMLKDEGFLGSARRDFYLLNTQVDLGRDDMEEALKGFLDPNDGRFQAPEVCAVLLSGHELDNYPVVSNGDPFPEEIAIKSEGLIEVLEKNAKNKEIDSYHIDLFLVPFPNVQNFRELLLKELGLK